MKTVLRTAPILLTATLGLAACGAGEDTGPSLSGADADIAASLAASWDANGAFPSDVSTECLANEFVAGIGGADGFSAFGADASNVVEVLAEQPLDQDDALTVADAMFQCDDFKEAYVGMVMGSEAEGFDCLAASLSDDSFVSLIASTFMGDSGSTLEADSTSTMNDEMATGADACSVIM